VHKLAALLLVVLFAVPATAGSTTASGLYGKVTRGPIRPVCSVDVPCDGPAQVTLVFKRIGAAPMRIRSTATGRYRVWLRYGYYTVTTTQIGPSHWTKPAHVHVRRGHFDRIDFSIDTGIR
jgi:hypothetical protein